MNPTQNKTRIVYETELDMLYDLEGNTYQREQMLGKCQRMAIKFGSLAAFRKRLEDKAEILRLAIKPKKKKLTKRSKACSRGSTITRPSSKWMRF